MRLKHVLSIAGCVLLGIIILIILHAFSSLNEELQPEVFTRRFSNTNMKPKYILNIEHNSFYIAGSTNNKIYLGNTTAPFHLLISNTTLTDTQHVNIKIKGYNYSDSYRVFRLKIDSPLFYLSHGEMPSIYRGNIYKWKAERMKYDSAYFAELSPIGSSTFILRSYSPDTKGFEIAKERTDTPYFDFKFGILEKQSEGLFSTDGKLLYNKENKKLIYLYTYRNQYILMDTSLTSVTRHNTIDTFSIAKIKVSNITETNSMLSSPPQVINEQSCTSKNFLFIKSSLLSRTENKNDFIRSSVIDVYDINSGKYYTSFYIPDYKNTKPSSFYVHDKTLFAIFNHDIIRYDLAI